MLNYRLWCDGPARPESGLIGIYKVRSSLYREHILPEQRTSSINSETTNHMLHHVGLRDQNQGQ